MIRRLIIFIVTILLIYFILGFFAAKNSWISWFDLNTYYSLGTIVGGISSVCGLLGLAYAKSTAKDLEDIEADYLRKVADLREELETKEKQVITQTKDIESLTARKEILELSIQRASRVLFIKTKKEEKEKEINVIITKEKKVVQLIKEIDELNEDLKRLGEEIKSDKNVETIREILKKEGAIKKEQDFEIFKNLPLNPITAIIVLLGRILRAYDKMIKKILGL